MTDEQRKFVQEATGAAACLALYVVGELQPESQVAVLDELSKLVMLMERVVVTATRPTEGW